MHLNNLKIAFRSFSKNRLFVGLNVFGLAIGLMASLLIFRIVQFEWSFNSSFPAKDRIVRVVTTGKEASGETEHTPGIPLPAMDMMQQTVPQFELFTRVHELWPTLALPSPGGGGGPLKKFVMESDGSEIGFFAEPDFLKIFDWPVLGGEAANALGEVGNIVLTKSWAEKCFGSWQAALDQTMLMDNTVRLTVRGVVADPPLNCDLPFAFLVSYKTLPANAGLYFFDPGWGSISSNDQAFARLRDPKQWAAANAALALVGDKEYRDRGVGEKSKTHLLQPLSDLHFNEDYGTSGSHRMPRSRIWVLSFIGLLILLMACFNFINLATAQATLRAREVGVRKTMGGTRGQLISQFFGETALLTGISVLIGAALAWLMAPFLKKISDVPDAWPFFSQPVVWLFLVSALVLMTAFSGLYPALVLSGFSPVKAFRRNLFSEKAQGVPLRKVLVVGQFAIAQGLIIGTLVTILQLDYVQKKELGFQKDLVVRFGFQNDSSTIVKIDGLKQRLLSLPSVEAVSFSNDLPSSNSTWSNNFSFGNSGQDAPFNVSMKYCDSDYAKTFGLNMAAGRWLEPTLHDTIREVVVNETLLRKLGVRPEEAVGQNFRLGGRRKATVVGVVKDFHSHSLRETLEPLAIMSRRQFYFGTNVKIRPDNIPATMAALQKTFDETFPEQVFEGQFFDETIARFYDDENRFANTCRGFAGLAILISCLGLFGLATHAAQRRTKEIGVRKALGASVANLTGLLAKDFLRLVLAAIAIAAPISIYLMRQWLADFAYRIDIEWWMVAGTALLVVAVAFLTVSYQSVKAALADPVKSLRSE